MKRPGSWDRPKDNLFPLLPSSVPLGTDVHAGLGHTAAKGLVAGCVVRGPGGGGEVGSKFIQLVLKSRSFLLGPSASIRGAGKMPLHLCELFPPAQFKAIFTTMLGP